MLVTETDLAALSRSERVAFTIASFVNESERAKTAADWFVGSVGRRWTTLVSAARTHVVGMKRMSQLTPDRGLLVATNHRSFFDLALVTAFLRRHTAFCRRFFYPVRSAFIYDHPLGVLVNAVASAMAMYPPVFRGVEKRSITLAGLDFLGRQLARPGTVVGLHPEGTRNKGSDPYALLPAQQGFGRVVLAARPIVIPVFINGLGNELLQECRATFDGTGCPIVIVYGEPMDLSEFADADPHRLRTQVEVSRKVLGRIAELGETERKVRAALESGRPTAEALANIEGCGSQPLDVRSEG